MSPSVAIPNSIKLRVKVAGKGMKRDSAREGFVVVVVALFWMSF